MPNSQEKPIFMQPEPDVDRVEYEDEVWGQGRGCFNLFCFKWRPFNDADESDALLHQRGEEHTVTWWKSKLNSLKQVSEKIAGPKWKNFIRKMSGYCHKRKCRKNKFQYDADSYALNFDDGADGGGDDLLRNFSSRYAAPFEDDRQRARSGV
ncbi:hypothetical protein HRI_003431400 [Hibiscus trionum]|uniref:Stress induced protein n=1 Tax=Hibiscus trionum TaxID=183268 RepID=A0A9W7IL89_HIBTR|nr:hypothetical protein HRI_003431400 [Hibiscus trionum]